jgi:hypothetical protein
MLEAYKWRINVLRMAEKGVDLHGLLSEGAMYSRAKTTLRGPVDVCVGFSLPIGSQHHHDCHACGKAAY